MPTDDQPHCGHPLFREIVRDFESLVRLIDRAIEHFATGEADIEDLLRLRNARKLAELGAILVREMGPPDKS